MAEWARAGCAAGAAPRVDPGLLALVAELRAHERQAAEELGQWVERHEEHNNVNLVAILNAGRERARQTALEEEARKEANAAQNGR